MQPNTDPQRSPVPALAKRRRGRHRGRRVLLGLVSLPVLALAMRYSLAGFIAIGQGIENADRGWAQLCLLLFIGLFAWAATLTHALVRAHLRRALVLAAATSCSPSSDSGPRPG